MRTLVLGGGVVGVTTAYFLARAGHEVTLVEQQASLGLEATSGNAGIIAPGHSFAWASPRAPRMLWESLRGAETAIRVRLSADPRLYAWGLRFLREALGVVFSPGQASPGTDASALAVFRTWTLIYAVVGAQMGWILRPFLGDPGLPFQLFREREKNFFVAILETLRALFQ